MGQKICPKCLKKFSPTVSVCADDGEVLLLLGDNDPLIGTLASDRYLVLKHIGSGGMGVVYLAHQYSMKRMIALKVLSAGYASDEIQVQRFIREAQVTAGLKCPSTIAVYDFGTLPDGAMFLAMEFLTGRPLGKVIKDEGPLGTSRSCRIASQICLSLEEAHSHGLVHRDLKPSNIMINAIGADREYVKVLDFGIVKVQDNAAAHLSQTGQYLGTPAYMSPEQFEGNPVSAATDVYSLGAVLYEMLTATPVFTGNSPMTYMVKHCTETPPSITDVLESNPLTMKLDRILHRCLAKKPGDRYQSASVLLSDIEAAIGSPQGGQIEKTGAAPSTPGTSTQPAIPPGRKFWSRRRWLLSGLFGSLLVAAGLLFLIIWRDTGPIVPAEGPIRLLVLPFEHQTQRSSERVLWPLMDRVIVNRFIEKTGPGSRLEVIDPEIVAATTQRLEISGNSSSEVLRELIQNLNAHIGIHGRILRDKGKTRFLARLANHTGVTVFDLELTEKDMFDAADRIADSTISQLPLVPPGEQPAAKPDIVAWNRLVSEPWLETRYAAFLKSARQVSHMYVQNLAESLVEKYGKGQHCLTHVGEVEDEDLQDEIDGSIRAFARPLCLFRMGRHKDAVTSALEPFGDLRQRGLAASFIAKVQVTGHSIAERIGFLERVARLFPERIDTWWLLATLYSAAGREKEKEETLGVADALSLGRDLNAPEALNGLRTSILLRDFNLADSWVGKLERSSPRHDWDLLFATTLKAALLKLRGRFKDAEKVLESRRLEFASKPGDPYTILAIELFYGYLYERRLAEAGNVVAQFKSFFLETDKPDAWTARILDLAFRSVRDGWSKDAIYQEAKSLADSLYKSIGQADIARKEQEGALCLLLTYVGDTDRARELAQSADPKNTMIAGCRFHLGLSLFHEGRYEEAVIHLEKSRHDMLYRGDWYLEFYPQAMISQAMALEKLGENKKALRMYRNLTQQYLNADRDLPESREAHAAITRLEDTLH